MKKTLCLDFDGVLHSYSSGWKGAEVVTDPPVPGAEEFLARAVELFHVAVLSSRSHQPGGIGAMRAWCEHHFSKEIVDQIDFCTEKPSAHVTLDDRAVTFTGVFPDPRYLLQFTPWNR